MQADKFVDETLNGLYYDVVDAYQECPSKINVDNLK